MSSLTMEDIWIFMSFDTAHLVLGNEFTQRCHSHPPGDEYGILTPRKHMESQTTIKEWSTTRKFRGKFVCNVLEMALTALVVISCISGSLSIDRSECHYSRDQLLSMKPRDAFEILLNFYDQTCPSDIDLDRSLDFHSEDSPFAYHALPVGGEKSNHRGSASESDTEAICDCEDDLTDISRKTREWIKEEALSSTQRHSKAQYDDLNQYDILVQFYDAFNGDNWLANWGWKQIDTPICQWYGVYCSPYSCLDEQYLENKCPVIALDMDLNNLLGEFGAMASVLEQMATLSYLSLRYNSINGNLTDLNLPQLSYLDLYENYITGTIPDFQGMPVLRHLEISGNELEGTIPDFSAIPYIRNLWLGKSPKLTGTLPNFSRLYFLEDMEIYRTKIYGDIPDFQNTPYMSTLSISRNKLNGTIPNFSHTPSIYTIYLNGNKLSGTIPNFGNIPKTRNLNLSFNLLSGTIPNFRNLASLETLSLYINDLSGAVPEFNRVPFINYMDLAYNQLNGTLPNFRNISNVEVIYLDNNQLGGTIPDFIGLKSVRTVSFSNNQLEGTIPNFRNLTLANKIEFSFNKLYGGIPDFDKVPNLYWIYLSSNQLSGTVHDFSKIPNLNEFDFSYNQLNGSIPNFSNIRYIWAIRLSNNQLSGMIPNFDNIPYVSVIDFSNNQLTGMYPSFSDLLLLQRLDLFGNQLLSPKEALEKFFNVTKGSKWKNNTRWIEVDDYCDWYGITCDSGCISIVKENKWCPVVMISLSQNNLNGDLEESGIGAFVWMENMDLSINRLHGTIPNFDMPYILSIKLNDNSLSGTIPTFNKIPDIRLLDLSSNNLVGSIPDFEKTEYLQLLDLSSNKLTEIGDIYVEPLLILSIEKNLISGEFPKLEYCPLLIKIIASMNNFSSVSEIYPSFIQSLDLSNNRLTGSLPDLDKEFLTELDLSFNDLTDQLPSWNSLRNLKKLDLYGNERLIGTLPSGMDNYNDLSILSVLRTNMMKVPSVDILPKVLQFSDSYQIEKTQDKYQCPIVKANVSHSIIEVNSTYYDRVMCKCLPGYFGFRDKCVKCPKDCECDDGVSLKKCFFTPHILDIVEIVPCLNPDVCNFIIGSSIEDKVNISRGEYVFPCKKGYTGRTCSKCEDGYLFESGECNECSFDYSAAKVIAFLIVLVFGVLWQIGMAWFGESTQEDEDKESGDDAKEGDENGSEEQDSASLDIFLFYTQILQVLGAIIAVPDFNFAGKFVGNVFSLRLPSLECIVGNQPHVTALLNLARIPSIVLLAYLAFKKFLGKKDKRNVEKVVAVMFIFLEGTYFSVVQDVMNTLGCTIYDKGLDVTFVNTYPWIQCNPITDSYAKMIGAAIIGLIYMVFYPSLLWLIVLRARKMRRSGEETAALIGESPPTEKSEAIEIEMTSTNQVNITRKGGHDDEDKQSKSTPSKTSSSSQVSDHEFGKEDIEMTTPTDEKGLDLSLSTFDLVCQIQIDRFSAIYEKKYDWWVVVRVFQSIFFGFTAFVVPYTSPAILYFVFFILIQVSITLQNRFEPYLVDSDDTLSINCWLLLYISFFAALVQQLVPGNDWISFAIIGLNGIFVAVFVIHYSWGVIKSLRGVLSGTLEKLGFGGEKVEAVREKVAHCAKTVLNIILNLFQ